MSSTPEATLTGIATMVKAIEILNQNAIKSKDTFIELAAVDLQTETGEYVGSIIFDDDGHALFNDEFGDDNNI